MFLILNPLLYVEEISKGIEDSEDIVELLLFFQKSIIYFILFLVGTIFVLDFIPNSCVKP